MTSTLDATDTRFVELAEQIGAVAAAHAADHDRDATFVAEAYAAMREHGYLALAVPTEMGGLGATMRQVCHRRPLSPATTAPPRWPSPCTCT